MSTAMIAGPRGSARTAAKSGRTAKTGAALAVEPPEHHRPAGRAAVDAGDPGRLSHRPTVSIRMPAGGAKNGVLPGRERQLGRAGRKLDEAEGGAGGPLQRIARRGPTEPMAEIEGGEEIAGAVGRMRDRAVGHQLRTRAA